jgi:hypothetical protein
MRFALAFTFCLLFLAGCASARVDWNARVGQYTYDQALLELGVPDRSATLTDGTTIAEWLSGRGAYYGTYHYFPGSPLHTYDFSQFPDRYLRLVFGPDNKLIRAEKFAR